MHTSAEVLTAACCLIPYKSKGAAMPLYCVIVIITHCNLIGHRLWNNSRYSTVLDGDVLNNIATTGYYEE